MQFLDGGYGVRPGHPAAVMVAPQAGQLGGVGKNHIRIIFRQHVLGPQFSLGSVQQGGLGLLAVCLPALLQLGKQGVVALRGADQFHETGFRPVNKLLVRQDNAQGVSYIEENGLDIGGHGSSSFEIQGRGPTAGKRGDPRGCDAPENRKRLRFLFLFYRSSPLFVNISNVKAQTLFLLDCPKCLKNLG